MRLRSTALAFGLAIVVAACGSPPRAELDAAKASVDKAESSGAGQYAPQSLKAAEEARAALDAELKAQDAKTFKSYDKAKQLASEAQAAGDKATAEAAALKEKAEVAKAARERAAAIRVAAKARAVPVGGKIKPPVKIKNVAPVYPEIARSARVSGAVVVEATVGEDGKVMDTRILHSIPLLDQAALDAVRQWEYTPTLLNGKPVPVVTTVTINFTKP